MNFITALKSAHDQIKKNDNEKRLNPWSLFKGIFSGMVGALSGSVALIALWILAGTALVSSPAAPAVILFISASVAAFGLAALTGVTVYYAVRGLIHGIETLVLAKKMMHDDKNSSNNQTNSTVNVQRINMGIDNSISKDSVKTLNSNQLVSDSLSSTKLNVTSDNYLKAIELDKHPHPILSKKNNHPEKLFSYWTGGLRNTNKHPDGLNKSKINHKHW